VNLRSEVVKNTDFVTGFEQRVGCVGSHEPCATGDENPFAFQTTLLTFGAAKAPVLYFVKSAAG
jgi:hypothetical protein